MTRSRLNKNIVNENSFIVKNRFSILCVFILFVFMGVQLVVLGLYGTQGDKLANVIQMQKNLAQENDKISSQINDLQSITRIEQIVTDKYGLVKATDIKTLDINDAVSLVK
ncbi:MAG: hypothetical protein WCO33_04585 [bacterium]